MSDCLSIAILSDMHCSAPATGKTHTHALVDAKLPKKQDPVGDLFDLIESEGLQSKFVMSPGDLANMSCSIGLHSAWRALQDVRAKLGAERVIATVGNHDIQSRDFETTPEIWEALKLLKPTYPISDSSELQRLHYWAEHFAIIDSESIRCVVLNSCHAHARGKHEYEKGRITDYTIDLIEKCLRESEDRTQNILLCHHHPSQLPDLNELSTDYSAMQHGEKLLAMLENVGGNWLVLHGHKHFPRLEYGKGGADSPVLFSAGSFSATLPDDYFATTSNQFYILDIDLNQTSSSGTSGTVRAWDWVKGTGWSRAAKYDSARPDRIIYGSGFGNRSAAVRIAGEVAASFSGSNRVEWSEVVIRFPDIKFMRTQDRVKMMGFLESKHGLRATSPDPFDPQELIGMAIA